MTIRSVPDNAAELDATYDYVDAEGRLRYQVLRYRTAGGGKTFRQRRPDVARAGQWVANLDGVERLPYRLPDLLDVTEAGGLVVVVEGEKDAERLAQVLPTDVAITTSAQGTGWDWPDEWADYFRGAQTVYVVADNDEQGRRAAHQRGRVIAKAVRDVRVVDALPGVPDKGDVSDYLDAGGTVDGLWRALEAGRPPRPSDEDGNVDNALLVRLQDRTITGTEILSLPEPRFLIDGYLLLDSLAILYGPPAAGKSLLTLDWALSVASGSWWEGRAITPGPVLYVVAEGASGIPARFNAWRLKANIWDGDALFTDLYWLLDAPNLYDPAQAAAFVAYAAALKPVLIILDTFARVIVGAEENSAKDVGHVIAHLEALRQATGACVLSAHHTPKSGDGIRGSTAILGAVDTALELKPADGIVTLAVAKQKNAAPILDARFVIRGEGDSVVLTPARGGADLAIETLPANYRKALAAAEEANAGRGASATDWQAVSAGAGVPKATFYRARKALLDLGLVAAIPAGRFDRYVVTDLGRTVIGLSPLGEAPPADDFDPDDTF